VDLALALLGLIGWAIGFMFVMVLMRMCGDQDHAARRQELLIDPYSDVTITRSGVTMGPP